jgi:heme/copper-type cytochrome/quinol oxidase subunit 4
MATSIPILLPILHLLFNHTDSLRPALMGTYPATFAVIQIGVKIPVFVFMNASLRAE